MASPDENGHVTSTLRRRPERGVIGDEDELMLDPVQLDLVEEIHAELLENVDLEASADLSVEESRPGVERVARALTNERARLLPAVVREEIVARVIDEVLGLGPIERMVQDSSISEIMVNDIDEVYYERDGQIHESKVAFRDHAHVKRIIDRIVSTVGRRVDESSPMVDARLMDGSRVNAAIPPVVPRSPVITIRKFRSDKYTLQQLTDNGTLNGEAAEFLGHCVKLRLNILISGGTGSGKTTFLNALSEHIPETERIVTIEDPMELKLQQRHVISMETRPSNIEGKNAITQRDLFRNSLRMRPDRILVGEVRGGEAFDMMQAMNTGHDGSLTTVHANSPRDALSRLENMVLMAGYDLPVRAIREQVASALQLIIQIARMSDGSRRITRVTEITGMEDQVVTLQDVYVFNQEGIDEDGRIVGKLDPTGLMPTFHERFSMMGVDLSQYLFSQAVESWTQ